MASGWQPAAGRTGRMMTGLERQEPQTPAREGKERKERGVTILYSFRLLYPPPSYLLPPHSSLLPHLIEIVRT